MRSHFNRSACGRWCGEALIPEVSIPLRWYALEDKCQTKHLPSMLSLNEEALQKNMANIHSLWKHDTKRFCSSPVPLCCRNWSDHLCLLKICAVCPSTMTVKEQHLSAWKDSEGKTTTTTKKTAFCSTTKINTNEVKPSLLTLLSPDYISYERYIHRTSRLLTISSDHKRKYKTYLSIVRQ